MINFKPPENLEDNSPRPTIQPRLNIDRETYSNIFGYLRSLNMDYETIINYMSTHFNRGPPPTGG